MKNLAPAIFPPKGIGDAKPANKAVLDWVHEIATLTQPENIFWCDGSERENEFLIAESLKQNVLIEAEREESSALVSAPVESERRRACRAVHFCLHTNKRGSRADEQLV